MKHLLYVLVAMAGLIVLTNASMLRPAWRGATAPGAQTARAEMGAARARAGVPQAAQPAATRSARAPDTGASLAATSLDAATEHAFAVASPSVVYINNLGVGSGSGVIANTTGDIVTNAHVVADATRLWVRLRSGATYPARLVGTDTADDLAVLHINAAHLQAARFAAAGTYQVAQTVLAIGNPLGLQQTVTAGLISALDRTVQEPSGSYLPQAIQTSAPINPGNSGGALVLLDGRVVGIPTLQALDPQNNNGGAAQGIGFAVPSPRVAYIAQQLIARGRVAHTGRAYLGVVAIDATVAGGERLTSLSGALVQRVASDSPAAQARLRPGDVIVAADGATIAGESDLLGALAKARPGATMTLTVTRVGVTLAVRVQLGELPAGGPR